MAIKRITYSKHFETQNYTEEGKIFQEIQNKNRKDMEIQKQIFNDFNLGKNIMFIHQTPFGENSQEDGNGFDGKQYYHFEIKRDPNPNKNTKEKIKYQTQIEIIKAGRGKDLIKDCDLEKFIIKKGFERIKW